MEMLRFTTAGSVDDGKSTLIGRLLYDTGSLYADQVRAVERSGKQKGLNHVDLALITDGLKDEREQGITIDVAYRYFSTDKRKFIIADTPGHVQYTRNMVTGASTADLALVLIDARKGPTEQTRRHAFIASLLGIPHIVFCVNKMDLVDYDRRAFEKIVRTVSAFSSKLHISDIRFVPVSALKGDNVAKRSDRMDWHKGPSLLYLLETTHVTSNQNLVDARFPVQTVIRPHTDQHHDYRGYAGRIASGVFRPGQQVAVLPSGFTSKIKVIDTPDGLVDEAFAPMSVAIRLEDDLDVGRGDMIVRVNNRPSVEQNVDAMICWLSKNPVRENIPYGIQHTSKTARAMVNEIVYKVDVNTLSRKPENKPIGMNDIARVRLRTTQSLFFDSYRKNRTTGSFILIDEDTHETVAAGMII